MNCIHCNHESKHRLCATCLKDNNITITCAKAKQRFKLTTDDLKIFEITKRRYYINDITTNLAIITEIKEQQAKLKAEQDKIESNKRKKLIQEYLDSKQGNFPINLPECNTLIKKYYDIKIGDEVYTFLDEIYEKNNELKRIKQIRKDDILSAIDKHEMKNYELYADKLSKRIDEYVNNDNLTLGGHFTEIVNEYTRTKTLYDKFEIKGIEPRMDSYLCRNYVNRGIESIAGSTNDMGTIKSVDDIVDIMYAMDFLYSTTSYAYYLNEVHQNKYKYADLYEDLASIAKRKAVKDWLSVATIGEGGLTYNKKNELPARLLRYA